VLFQEDFIRTDCRWYCSSPNTSHLPFYCAEKSRQIQSWCETQLTLAAWQPLILSSGFGPGLQSTKLSLNNDSLSTINSCLSSLHTLWARSPLSVEAFLLSSITMLLPVQVTADWCWLPVTHCLAFTKSLNPPFFFSEKMPITRGSHVNSADDRNHLLFVTLLPTFDGLLKKGSVYVCTKILLHWYSFGGCSCAPILIIISSSYLKRALYGKNGGQWGVRDSNVGNTRLSVLLFCRDVHGVSRTTLIK